MIIFFQFTSLDKNVAMNVECGTPVRILKRRISETHGLDEKSIKLFTATKELKNYDVVGVLANRIQVREENCTARKVI